MPDVKRLSLVKPTLQTHFHGNYDWTDDSGDGIQEPLLDVSNAAVFNPVLIPGSGGGGGENQSPLANFSYTTSGLTATFTDTSTDPDGNITSWSWNFGDGGTSTSQNPSHTYSAGGNFTVSLEVTDGGGLKDATSKSVTVSSGGGGTVTVASLVGSSAPLNKTKWKATVTVTIDPFLSGAVVSGAWSSGASASCTTNAGQCTVSLTVSTKIPSVVFPVSNVALTGYEYVEGVTTVTVYYRPS